MMTGYGDEAVRVDARASAPCHTGRVNEPIRLFLVSPARAIRRALARSLDAEAEILVVGEAASAVDALARAPASRRAYSTVGDYATIP